MDTIYESGGLVETVQSAADSFAEKKPKSKEARMLIRLLQERPKLSLKRFWRTATQAESAGEVGVTEPLRVPVFPGVKADLDFIDSAIGDMNRRPTDWSLVMEDEGHGYPGISFWRVPPAAFIKES